MWKLIFDSAAGVSHERSGLPCQDYCLGQVVETPQGPILIVVCADGAGSASHSALGARIACDIVLDRVWEWIKDAEFSTEQITRGQIQAWFEAARDKIGAEASDRGIAPRDMACTLLLAIVGETWAAFAQVGDGAIVQGEPDGCRTVFWPEAGEYANTTTFLTDATLADRLQFDVVEGPIDELAVLTDGLQMLALDYRLKQAHTPFFQPMFAALQRVEDVSSLKLPFRDFLNSPRVNERTDDDKTLMLATRRACADVQTYPSDEPR